MEVELLKSGLLKALALVNDALVQMAGDCVEIRRWSTGDLQVLAAKEIPARGVAFAPMVTGMAFFALSSRKGGLPQGAVRLNGFGPRASGTVRVDRDADGDNEANAGRDGGRSRHPAMPPDAPPRRRH